MQNNELTAGSKMLEKLGVIRGEVHRPTEITGHVCDRSHAEGVAAKRTKIKRKALFV